MNTFWMKTSSLNEFQPITQVYGICFNQHDEILICRKNVDSEWQLPGGKPLHNEAIEVMLKREFLEEVQISIKNIQIVGVQKVIFPDNPNNSEGEEFYQLRMICEVSKILPQQTDPSTGIILERKFIPYHQINNYILWGNIGEKIFNDAFLLKGI